jgi:thiamine kinase-like enzyme
VNRSAWRFLLPLPPAGSYKHAVLLGGPESAARQILDAGLASAVSRSLPHGQVADLVLRFHDATTDLAAAARCLQPGGSLYAELDIPPAKRPLSVQRMHATLRRAGCVATGIYWCRPGFAKPNTYVPLNAPNVLRWYCDNVFRAVSARESLLRPVARTLAPLGAGVTSTIARSIVVTGVAGDRPRAKPFLLASQEVPHTLRSVEPRLLLLTGRNERAILLCFTDGSDYPLAAIKVSNEPRFNEHTRTEQRVLAEVRKDVDEAMRNTIPAPYGCLDWHGLTVGIDEGAPGRLLGAPRSRWNSKPTQSIDDFRRVAGWLTELHRQTGTHCIRWSEIVREKPIADAFARFAHAFGDTPDQRALFDAAARLSERLADALVPWVWSQGDFNAGNIYRDGDTIHVIDWAAGGKTLPLFDLLKFAEQWNNHVHRTWSDAARVSSFTRLFVEPDTRDPLVRAMHEEIFGYADRLDLDRRLIPLLMVLLWVDLALHHHALAEGQGAAAHATYARAAAAYVRALAAARQGERFAAFEMWGHAS